MNIERTGRIIFRTPAYPLEGIYQEVSLDKLVEDGAFLSAIYIASPVLFEEIISYKNGNVKALADKKKLEFSLLKYYLRASGRCTPFGLFSACGSVVDTKEAFAGRIAINVATGSRRYSRLDMHYLCSLAQFLSKSQEIALQLTFYPNQTMYKIGSVWRYIEYYYHKGNRVHQISSVDQSPILNQLLEISSQGINLTQFTTELLKFDDSLDMADVRNFFQELVSSHILISELEPAITGTDFLQQILQVLSTLKAGPDLVRTIAILEETDKLLKHADSLSAGMELIKTYKQIVHVLRQLDLEFDEGKLFQVDSFWDTGEHDRLEERLCKQVDMGVELLSLFTLPQPTEHLNNFRNKFTARYEEQEIPLLQALDIESGVGYGQLKGSAAVSNSARSIPWSWVQDFLHKKLQETLKFQHQELIITDKDFNDIIQPQGNAQQLNLAPSFSAMFRIVHKPGTEQKKAVLIEHIGGCSAASLLGRFASHDKKIDEHIRQICDKEQQINKDILFAEIIHLPQSRVGNILLHPPFRRKEIPYMGVSSLSAIDQILLEDIMVSVRQNKIVLRSRRLNKEIIPRLSNAHNYSFNAQPVYHFLCDLQYQDIAGGLFIGWGYLQQMYKYLPRITYKDLILAPAQWHFQKQEFSQLLEKQEEQQHLAFEAFCKQWNLPELFVLADGDNELPVFRDNKIHVELFLQVIKSRENIILRELLVDKDSLVKDNAQKSYNCQFLASYVKNSPTYTSIHQLTQRPLKTGKDKRTFMPGSEWVFFKIYCGVKTTDEILIRCVVPVISKLKKLKKIDKWFFIRYADPDHHIRVRFHLADGEKANLTDVTANFMQLLASFEKMGLIWKVTMDTYNREIERYRHKIRDMENIFWYDSESFLDFLKASKNQDNKDDFRWMFALKSIDQLMGDFNLAIEEKLSITKFMSESFNREFGIEKKEKVGLDILFRNKSREIEAVIEPSEVNTISDIYTILNRRTAKLKPVIQDMFRQQKGDDFHTARQDILFSCIHMVMNRICPENARHEEMVMYNNLYRYYRSKSARLKYN